MKNVDKHCHLFIKYPIGRYNLEFDYLWVCNNQKLNCQEKYASSGQKI